MNEFLKVFKGLFENPFTLGLAAFPIALSIYEFNRYIEPNSQGSLLKAIFLFLVGVAVSTSSTIVSDIWKAKKPSIANWFIEKIDTFQLWLTDRFQSKYYQNLAYDCESYKTEGLKTGESITLDLAKVFVSLTVARETPENISAALIPSQNTTEDLDFWEILAQNYKQSNLLQIAIIAPPGAGKTTMLRHIALAYARNAQRRQHPKAPQLIPVLLELRNEEIQKEILSKDPPTLADLIQEQTWVKKLEPPRNWFKNRIDKGKCLIMLDGLDEVADLVQRQKVSKWVNEQMRGCSCIFICTSRPYGYRSAPIERVKLVLEIKPFNLKQVERFIQQFISQRDFSHDWNSLPSDRRTGKQRSETTNNRDSSQYLIEQIKQDASLRAMAVNPLLLRLIVTVYCSRGTLPSYRVDLYERICDILLERIERRQDNNRDISPLLKERQIQKVLQTLALGLMKGDTPRGKTTLFTLLEGRALIENRLKDIAGENIESSSFFKDIDALTGLLMEREKGVWQFPHKSFQEYLAALEIRDKPENLTLLTYNLDDSWWEETIRFYAVEKDADAIVKRALAQSTAKSLALAYACVVTEEAPVSSGLRKELTGKLEAGLASEDWETFRLAASVQVIQRIKKFIQVNDKLAVDYSGYVTNAEYQLFLEANFKSPVSFFNRRSVEERSPSQGAEATSSVEYGDPKAPVLGISSEDAHAFCDWLTIHYLPNELSEGTIRYRVISNEEIQSHRIAKDKELENRGGIRLVRQHSQDIIPFLSYRRITPPNHPLQCRAIGLLRGKYHPSSPNLFRKGQIVATDGTIIDTVLLGRVLRTARKLDLSKNQIWVVFPRTRSRKRSHTDSPYLHVQIKGVKAPQYHRSTLNNTDLLATVDEDIWKIDSFSVRGIVINQNPQRGYIMVEIKTNPYHPGREAQSFELRLEGRLPSDVVGTFWNFRVERRKYKLVIRECFRP
ncbi:NACHT domain-containing protein [Leptolyngbya cf. ectocarpi LEGE 11479]|uniref:NACHT domain-containing protein n=1 Tax=Leptolyngbya cf. ectocarpi LEGE 11479 TaxID=1828722 RepID=A0A928X139_LEPEC|nr:NACHT domain-containing protein [Leptolyngbya ectocarpi]MBE9065614.1 NACHT domain-containing protein [Leptolyngbya cf. ectocarpi LEGE 11479]